MEIKIEINEERIAEIAKCEHPDNIPSAIYSIAKNEAIKVAVNEIVKDVIVREYYDSKEKLRRDIEKEILSRIQGILEKIVRDNFTEGRLQKNIERFADKIVGDWVEKKIYERLEEAKRDIFIGSQRVAEEERKQYEDALNNE